MMEERDEYDPELVFFVRTMIVSPHKSKPLNLNKMEKVVSDGENAITSLFSQLAMKELNKVARNDLKTLVGTIIFVKVTIFST